MSTNATPGQIAYEAYLRAWSITGLRTWDDEPRGQQRAWEGAAQAVLADALRRVMPSTGTLTTTQCLEEMRRLVGQYWVGVDADAYVNAVRGETGTTEDAPC